MKKIILSIFITTNIFAAEGDFLKKALDNIKEDNFQSANIYLSNIKEGSPIYLYRLYLESSLKDIPNEKIFDIIKQNRNFAISSYIALKYASINFYNNQYKEAIKFIDLVDKDALFDDDIPFYLYLKSQIYEKNGYNAFNIKKELATEYINDRYYGYQTYMDIYPDLSEEDKIKAIENLIKKRMKERAKYVLNTLPETDAKYYYQIKLGVGDYNKIFEKIDKSSIYYKKAIILLVSKEDKYYRLYLEIIKPTKEEIEKDYFNNLENAFFKKDWKTFINFYQKIDKSSKYYPDAVWYYFLYLYRTDRYEEAKSYLLDNIDLIKDKSKAYYWLYLVSKKLGTENISYLKDIDFSNDLIKLSFYDIYAKSLIQPENIKKVSYTMPKIKNIYLNQNLSLIKELKDVNLYKWAYIESRYYLKKTGDLKNLYSVSPEVAVRQLPKDKIETFPKPFNVKDKDMENLIYSIIRQESYFNPYAISRSNAVGLMQFIPSTAKWMAQKLGYKQFDITYMFEPEISIEFGRAYLSHLINLFDGNLIYVVASYNAGEGNVKRFLNSENITDPVEFVEFFPYAETRDYVKKVLKNLYIYKNIEE